MATVLDLGADALKEIGVLAAGETPAAQDGADLLAALNRLVDSWAAERLQIYTVTRTTWTIVANDGQYTVGTGGDVNVARPVYIDNVTYQDTATTPNTEYPLVKLTEDAWREIVLKEQTSPQPTGWYYNPTFALATLDLWPVPTSSTLEGVLYAPAAVAEFAAVSTTVSLPPGYRRMIVKNLALEMATSYGRQPDPLLVRQAAQSIGTVKRANKRIVDLQIEPAALIQDRAGRQYNINTDR